MVCMVGMVAVGVGVVIHHRRMMGMGPVLVDHNQSELRNPSVELPLLVGQLVLNALAERRSDPVAECIQHVSLQLLRHTVNRKFNSKGTSKMFEFLLAFPSKVG